MAGSGIVYGALVGIEFDTDQLAADRVRAEVSYRPDGGQTQKTQSFLTTGDGMAALTAAAEGALVEFHNAGLFSPPEKVVIDGEEIPLASDD